MANNAINRISTVVTQKDAGGMLQLFLERLNVLSFAFSLKTSLAITAFEVQFYAESLGQVAEEVA